jgi:hypothetical protein
VSQSLQAGSHPAPKECVCLHFQKVRWGGHGSVRASMRSTCLSGLLSFVNEILTVPSGCPCRGLPGGVRAGSLLPASEHA